MVTYHFITSTYKFQIWDPSTDDFMNIIAQIGLGTDSAQFYKIDGTEIYYYRMTNMVAPLHIIITRTIKYSMK